MTAEAREIISLPKNFGREPKKQRKGGEHPRAWQQRERNAITKSEEEGPNDKL